MRLMFKQRLFTLLDNYDIFDDNGRKVYVVEGQLSLGHRLKIYDSRDQYVGMVKQRLLTLLPKFELYIGQQYVGCISRELTLFRPKYNIDCNGWHIEGDWLEWDYRVMDPAGCVVATVSKALFKMTDTYIIDVNDPKDALCALMLVLAIDAEKCSRD